jgi:predicted metal-dependent hydrolase
MNGEINIAGKSLHYIIKKNKRSRSISIRLRGNEIVVSQPYFLPYRAGQFFMQRNTAWIEKQFRNQIKKGGITQLKGDRGEYLQNKTQARKLITQRLAYFNQFYNFKYGRISIRNNSSRWGSCNRHGDLNFHYKLALIDPKVADYVIVHELCHVKHLNHSKKFWEEIAKTIPDYKARRTSLNKSAKIM